MRKIISVLTARWFVTLIGVLLLATIVWFVVRKPQRNKETKAKRDKKNCRIHTCLVTHFC